MPKCRRTMLGYRSKCIQPYRSTRLFGLCLFVGMLSVGYYYNLTFIQLGLADLGKPRLHMGEAVVAAHMAVIVVLTCVTAVGFSGWLSRRAAGFIDKLHMAFVVILIQALLTPIAQHLRSGEAFTAWIVVCSLALGVGVPATFGVAVDLVPREWRGRAAALIAGVLYDTLDVREMLYWIFGIFALTHLMYTLSLRLSATNAPLMMPILYVIAVSLYTVVNSALWADLSTPRTIDGDVAGSPFQFNGSLALGPRAHSRELAA